MTRPRIVIVGGGFGGLQAARRLRRADADVVIVDRHNYHLFQPLLYQVATAVLSPADIAEPIRTILRYQRNVAVVLGEVTAVVPSRRTLILGQGSSGERSEMSYDYLVLACGAMHSYFGHDAWMPNAPGLKTIDDALEIRRRVFLSFEEAEREEDDVTRRRELTFVVVGGGPTGVELAGAVKEIAGRSSPLDFRHVDTSTARVVLVEAGDRLLPAMHPALSARAERDLVAMGVEVLLRSTVTNVDRHAVWIGERHIDTQNVLWAAGVRAEPVAAGLGVPLDRNGRVMVGPDLSIAGHPEVFVIGDLAHVADAATGRPVPGLAPAAMQMGRFVGRLIAAELTGRATPRPAFKYFDKGTLATIGRNRAVAQIGPLRLGGFVAWLAWSLVHITFLVGFRNRLMVLLGWAWNYVVWKKGARLITGDPAVEIERPRDLHGKSAAQN
jgi:NADH dehydrogenase